MVGDPAFRTGPPGQRSWLAHRRKSSRCNQRGRATGVVTEITPCSGLVLLLWTRGPRQRLLAVRIRIRNVSSCPLHFMAFLTDPVAHGSEICRAVEWSSIASPPGRRHRVLGAAAFIKACAHAVKDLARAPLFPLQHMENDLVQRALCNAVVHVHASPLADSMGTIFCLQQPSWDPVELCKDNSLGCGEGKPVPARCYADQCHLHLFASLKTLHQGLAAVMRRPPVNADVGDPQA
mmetsp:Transcript_702/g.1861  ORF Transcript_702/g.1861 Transcript_702/m.1861 type:complete len:235 (+) Transcript_702:426-1130(+)